MFKISNYWNLWKSYAAKLKSLNKLPFIWHSNIYVVSKDYNQINPRLLYDKSMFLIHQKVPKVANFCFSSKESSLLIKRLYWGNFEVAVG